MTKLSPELQASFEQMRRDLLALNTLVKNILLQNRCLQEAVKTLPDDELPPNLPEQMDRFIAQLQPYILNLLNRHDHHMNGLFLDAARGVKVRESASKAGRSTSRKIQEKYAGKWNSWEDRARELWKKNPSMSARRVAQIIASQQDESSHTIRKRINHLKPSKRSTSA
jgi:hypothetical protein